MRARATSGSASRVISDDHNYGVLSFADVIIKSSNVGAIKVCAEARARKIGDYVKRFGFGSPSSPDFRGESPGMVWDPESKLNDSALASVAMGYQVGVTPLQMAAAVSAVANGGELVQPRAVRAVIRDGVACRSLVRSSSASSAPTPWRRSPRSWRRRHRWHREAGEDCGYTVAGKTGTAKKLLNGSYRGHSDYNVSFVGFVPSRKPVFAIVVVVDSPHKVSPYGGVVAAPIFQKIARRRSGNTVCRLRSTRRSRCLPAALMTMCRLRPLDRSQPRRSCRSRPARRPHRSPISPV